MNALKICVCCGKFIELGEPAVQVRYGRMIATAHPHYKVRGSGIDFFHAKCDKAFRSFV